MGDSEDWKKKQDFIQEMMNVCTKHRMLINEIGSIDRGVDLEDILTYFAEVLSKTEAQY